MKSPHFILEDSNFDFRYVRLCDLDIPREKIVELFSNSGGPDQTPRNAASDLGLHCLPSTLSGVSRLQWDNICLKNNKDQTYFSFNISLVSNSLTQRIVIDLDNRF